jgi:hypothetical protein
MQSVLLFALSTIGVAAFLVSLVATLMRYGSLPARVPTSFDGAGLPRAYGPRPAIFFMVGVQAFTLVVQAFVVAQTMARPGGAVAALLAAGVIAVVSIVLTSIQRQTLAIARGARARTTNPLVFAAIVTVVAVAAVVVGGFHNS